MPEAVQRLRAVLSAPDAKSEDNEMATDNAASALGKILEFHRWGRAGRGSQSLERGRVGHRAEAGGVVLV